jgi:hypothetical protein
MSGWETGMPRKLWECPRKHGLTFSNRQAARLINDRVKPVEKGAAIQMSGMWNKAAAD